MEAFMAERRTSISNARAKLPDLSRSAQKRMERHIITLQGEPQSVLIGYHEYQSMSAAVQMLQRPEILQDIKTGLNELDEGKGVPLSEMKARVREAAKKKETSKLAEELAVISGVNSQTVENILEHYGEKMMHLVSSSKCIFIPGVGEVAVTEAAGITVEKASANGHLLPHLARPMAAAKKGRRKHTSAAREASPTKRQSES
jgi:PHD/YefM family antitoxin component YafN of YafNO toxin-antitoxin module